MSLFHGALQEVEEVGPRPGDLGGAVRDPRGRGPGDRGGRTWRREEENTSNEGRKHRKWGMFAGLCL